MLEGLDAINWHQLEHAYGTAEDVPGLLRQLLAHDENVRRDALFELYGNIWHQGTVYEATSHAVPFLLEMACNPMVCDREAIISYLGTLAEGSSYIDVHRSLVDFTPEELSGGLMRELAWVRQTRSAVQAGENKFISMVSIEPPDIALAAAYALSRFPTEGTRYCPALRQRYLASCETKTKFGLGMLCAEFVKEDATSQEWLEDQFDCEQDQVARIGLAIALASSAAPQTRHLQFLADQMIEVTKLEQIFIGLPWDVGEPEFKLVNALCSSIDGKAVAIEGFNEHVAKKAPEDVLRRLRYYILDALDDQNFCFVPNYNDPIETLPPILHE